MLEMRAEQLDALGEEPLDRFRFRATEYLVFAYPRFVEAAGMEGVMRLLDASIRDASANGVGTERGIVTWAELSITHGEGFQSREPWATYILSLDLPSGDRVDRLREYVVADRS